MTLLDLTLKQMLESDNETIKRNSMSIYKTLQKHTYSQNPAHFPKIIIIPLEDKDNKQ